MEENDEGLEKEVEALKTELDTVKTENESLKTETDSVTAENKKLKELLAADKPDVEKLQKENAALQKTLKEAADTLQVFVDNQKTELIAEITEHTNLKADELKDMDLANLRLIKKTVDSFKGTKKGVKAAASSTPDSTKTVGDLYGQPQKVKPEVK